MRYLSPIFFFGDNFQLPMDSRMIQRERKKLLADLEVADGDSIVLGGRSFMKNELIDYFEELQQERIVAWHLAISADPFLLHFLQDATIDAGGRFKSDATYEDPEFIAWVAPYFGASLTTLAGTSFEHADASGLRALLANRLLMPPEDQEKCWIFISDILEKNIALFDHYRDRTQKGQSRMMPVTGISAYLSHGYFDVIRELPDSRFSRLKDRYAFSILHPAIGVFNRNKRNRVLATSWVQEAINLAVSEKVRDTIQDKSYELNAILKQANKTSRLRYIYLAVLVIGFAAAYHDGIDSNHPLIPMLSPKPARSTLPPAPSVDTLHPDTIRLR